MSTNIWHKDRKSRYPSCLCSKSNLIPKQQIKDGDGEQKKNRRCDFLQSLCLLFYLYKGGHVWLLLFVSSRIEREKLPKNLDQFLTSHLTLYKFSVYREQWQKYLLVQSYPRYGWCMIGVCIKNYGLKSINVLQIIVCLSRMSSYFGRFFVLVRFFFGAIFIFCLPLVGPTLQMYPIFQLNQLFISED